MKHVKPQTACSNISAVKRLLILPHVSKSSTKGHTFCLKSKNRQGTKLLTSLLGSEMVEVFSVRFSRPYLYPFVFYEFSKFSSRFFLGHTIYLYTIQY